MKIKLRSDAFMQFNGTIIDVELDGAGDAPLPKHIVAETGRIYAFIDEYEVVNGNANPGGYTLELQAKDLIQLHEILDLLPEFVLDSATLKMN